MLRQMAVAAVAALCTVNVMAYPAVGTDAGSVKPNVWTMQLPTAKARANEQGLPLLVVIVDSQTCGYCTTFDQNILQQQAWRTFIAQYPMFLVMLDRAKLSDTAFKTHTSAYRVNGGVDFPTIAIHAPNGAKLRQFLARDGYARDPYFYNVVRAQIEQFYGPGTISLTVTGQEVSENAGEVTVTVARQGGSAGAQSFSYATADDTAAAGTDYTAVTGTLTWANGDKANKSFAVPLLDNGRWTAPSQRVFTVTIAQVTGDADLGDTVQTVTINESEPYAPGTLGFSAAAGQVVEGSVYTGKVSRTGGAVGAAGVMVTVPPEYTVEPIVLAWNDSDSEDKTFTVSGINATEPYDRRFFNLTLLLDSGDTALGTDTQVVEVLDQVVSETFEAYTEPRPIYEHLAQSDELWFYNEDMDALRTEPLNDGEQAALVWTAPVAGRLTFTWGQNGTTAPVGAIKKQVLPCVGAFLLEVAGQSMVLNASETNNTVGVCAGDEVSWVVTGLTGDYVAYLKNLVWEPLAPVAADGLAPAADSKLQIDDVRADTNLVDLVWQAGAGNPADAVQRLFAGPAADTLIEVVPASGVVTSGLNAVSEGIVDLAQAQGWVYWRVDTQVAADLGAGVAQGAVWRFAVVDLPVFTDGAPAEGAALDAFLQAGAAITAAADSSTPVIYSAVGLPPGLVIDPATGAISGVAKREGIYQVTVTATNSEGSTDLAFTISTQALPAYASNSTLEGALFSAEVAQKSVVAREVTGSLSFKVGRTGKITAKIVVAGKKHSLRGGWTTGDTDGIFSAKLASSTGEELDVTLAQDGILRGTFDGMFVLARAVTAAEVAPFIGYYTAALPAKVLEVGSEEIDNRPQGYGYVTVTVSRAGKAKYSGLLADGTRLSGSATLMVFTGAELVDMGYGVYENALYAAFPIFKTLYRNSGSVAALVWIAGNALDQVGDNTVWLDDSLWHYPGQSSRLTDDAFLAVFGGNKRGATLSETAIMAGAFYVKRQDLQPLFESGQFRAAEETVPLVVSSSSLTLDRDNALGAKLKASASTGLFSGSIKQENPSTGSMETLKYKGVLLIGDGGQSAGYGAYQQQETLGSYRVKRSWPVEIVDATER